MACHVVTLTFTVICEGMPEAGLHYTFVLIYAKHDVPTRKETSDLFVVVATPEREGRDLG